MKKLSFLTFVLLFTVSFASGSNADVIIEDVRVNAVLDEGGITSGDIETAGGAGGNFELLVCGIDTEGPNPFNLPTPGTWDEINNSTCFLSGCQLGIWGRIADAGSPGEITCSWGSDSRGFVAGNIRYSSVDQDNPIIDSACTELVGENLVLPPVSSEPGAQLVFITKFIVGGQNPFPGDDTFTDFEFDLRGGGLLAAVDLGDDENIFLSAESNLDEEGEGTEELIIPADEFDQAFKLCVVSIRMQTESIPTMSEWGFLAVAVFMGAAGIWYLRRRQQAS